MYCRRGAELQILRGMWWNGWIFVWFVVVCAPFGAYAQTQFMGIPNHSDRTAAPAPSAERPAAVPQSEPEGRSWGGLPANACGQQKVAFQKMLAGGQGLSTAVSSVADADIVVVGEAHNHDEELRFYRMLIDEMAKRGKSGCLFLEQDERKIQGHLDGCNGDMNEARRLWHRSKDTVACPHRSGEAHTTVPGLTNYAYLKGWKVFAVDNHDLQGSGDDGLAIRPRNLFMRKRIQAQKARHQCEVSVVMQGSGHLSTDAYSGDTMQALLRKTWPEKKVKTLGFLKRDSHSFFEMGCSSGFFTSGETGHVVDRRIFHKGAPDLDGFRDFISDYDAVIWY